MRKPSCSADSVPSALAMPSIVVISEPSACTANMVQLFTDMPSMSTVQAPQCVVSQPIWVPVSCRFSRMKCTSSVRGSTRPSTSAPFTVIFTWVFAIVARPSLSRRGRRRVSARASTMMPPTCLRYSTGPRASAAGDMIVSAAAAAFFSVAASRLVPITALRGFVGEQRRLRQVGEADRAGRDLAAAHRQHHRGRGGGVVADLALQLLIGVAVAGRRASGIETAVRISPGSSAVK